MIEPILNMYKIKYENLNKMIKFTSGKYLNIFINLNSVLNSFYNSKLVAPTLRDLRGKETLIFSSEIINIIAHYRHYFWKYYRVPTTFYIYYNNGNVPIKNKKFNINYMAHQSVQRSENNPEFGQINKLFNRNIKLIKMIIDYIYDAYFVESSNIDIGILMYKIIKDNNDPERVNLILTRDKYDFQLLRSNNYIDGIIKTSLIYMVPKHIQWMDASDIIKKVSKIDSSTEYRPEIYDRYITYLGLLYAIGGLSSRSLTGVKGIGEKKAFRLIHNYWKDKNFFSNNITSFLIDDILSQNSMLNCTDYITNQYKSIDIEFGINYLLSESDNFYLSEEIYKNRYDNESIMELNNRYYTNNPINLLYLTEGCSLKAHHWKYKNK